MAIQSQERNTALYTPCLPSSCSFSCCSSSLRISTACPGYCSMSRRTCPNITYSCFCFFSSILRRRSCRATSYQVSGSMESKSHLLGSLLENVAAAMKQLALHGLQMRTGPATGDKKHLRRYTAILAASSAFSCIFAFRICSLMIRTDAK